MPTVLLFLAAVTIHGPVDGIVQADDRPWLTGHTKKVIAMSLTPDGKSLVSTGGDDTLRTWDLHKRLTTKTSALPKWPCGLSCANSRTVAVTTIDNKLRVHDVDTHAEVWTISFETGVHALAVSPDGTEIACGCEDGVLRLVDVKKKEVTRVIRGNTRKIGCVAYTPDGSRIATGGYDKAVRIFPRRVDADPVVLTGHRDEVWCIALSADGKTLVSGSADKSIRVWDWSVGKQIGQLDGHEGFVRCLCMLGQDVVVSGSQDETVRLWSTSSFKQLAVKRPGGGVVYCLERSRDGKTIYAGTKSGDIGVLEVASLKREKK